MNRRGPLAWLPRRRRAQPELARPGVAGPALVHEPATALESPPTIGRIHPGWRRTLATRQPSLMADGGQLCGIEVAAASMTGALHLQDGTERQDAYLLVGVGDVLLAAVADGVSSEPRAGWGARAACELTAEVLTGLGEDRLAALLEAGDPMPLAETLGAVETRLREYARELGLARDEDLATTLLVTLARSERAGVAALVASIGDSSALVLEGERIRPLLGPEPRSVSGLKHFLPREGAAASASATALWVGAGAGLVLATDGVAADIDESADVREWLGARWQGALMPLDAAHALTYRRQGSFDDRTAVVVKPSTEDWRSR